MMNKISWIGLALIIQFSTSCSGDGDTKIDDPIIKTEIVELTTSFGKMHIYLYDDTPLHKENFLKLVKDGFYNETEFHRIIKDFMIQGGDPLSKDDNRANDGTGGPGYTIEAEIDSSKHKHKYGALAAARKGDAANPQRASSGSQFYIVVNKKGTSFLDGKYSVFGEVFNGMDVAIQIVNQAKNAKDLPNKRIKMQMQTVSFTAEELESKFNFIKPQ